MISKDIVKQQLESVINDENRQIVTEIAKRIDGIPNDEWEAFIAFHNITEANLMDIIKSKIAKDKQLDEYLFEEINDLVSYGTTGDTLHIHIIPKNVKEMLNREGLKLANLKLIQALELIRNTPEMNGTIKTIFAVSPILRLKQLQKMFIELGFDVSETTAEDLLRRFPSAKQVYQASLPKSILLSKEWEDKAISISDSLNDRNEGLEYRFTNSRGKTFVGYPIHENETDTLSYILVLPKNLEDGKELIVESLNYEGTNIFDTIVEYEQGHIRNMLEIIDDAPIMIPFVPDVKDGRPYYQQLSRECFEESVDGEYSIDFPRVDLQVLDAITDAKRRIIEMTSKQVADRIFLNGYSSSGVFAQRFALLHPEIVGRALIGGAAGSIPLPTVDLEYPLGIKNFRELFGIEFNEEEYRKIQFGYYVGELETKTPAWERDMEGKQIIRDAKGEPVDKNQIMPPMHDMSYFPRSIDVERGTLQRNLLGQDLQDRWKRCIEYYEQEGYSITHKVYRGAEHKGIYNANMNPVLPSLIRDLTGFYKQGTSFSKDISGVEEISIRFQRERESLDDVSISKE